MVAAVLDGARIDPEEGGEHAQGDEAENEDESEHVSIIDLRYH
jgi:hypothetical protein